MAEPHLRPARPEDLAAIGQLLRTAALPVEDLTEAKLEGFIVAGEGQAVSGVVGLEVFGTAALLRSLAVAPERRGTGLGTCLLRAAEAAAAGRGVVALYLLTTTAAAFFEAAGYQPWDRRAVPAAIAETAEFADICPDSADCLRRTL